MQKKYLNAVVDQFYYSILYCCLKFEFVLISKG